MLENSAPIPRNQDLQAAGRVRTCEGYPWLETPMLSLLVKILTASRTVGGAVTLEDRTAEVECAAALWRCAQSIVFEGQLAVGAWPNSAPACPPSQAC